MTEQERQHQQHTRAQNWLQWGPYLSERQWGTVREDYSAEGEAWTYFSHEQARSRAYRWGEDGLAGISDDTQNLCFALTLWNGQDAILKERLFGLDNHQGNHGEDVKELYYYLDNTPTHSYQKQLYKYPQAAFPYEKLIAENKDRPLSEPEFELLDTGLFDENRYFDVLVEYAKAGPTDILIRLTARNHGPEGAPLHLLPTLWFRNTWGWGDAVAKPHISRPEAGSTLRVQHEQLGEYTLYFQPTDAVLITENETNTELLFQQPNATGALVKDAFHTALLAGGGQHASRTAASGSKAAPVYARTIGPGEAVEVRLRLSQHNALADPLGDEFAAVFADRQREADAFYQPLLAETEPALAAVKRQAWAGVLWSKQFYCYDVARWLAGDPGLPPPPPERRQVRNADWENLKAADIMLMPDKWEYPWFAAWDMVFHCLALAPVDIAVAKQQCLLLTSSHRYYKEDGQIPSYEFDFSNGNPAVRGQSTWFLFDYERRTSGFADWDYLRTAFTQLQPNYQWWLERFRRHPEPDYKGSFLGLDNASVLNREEVPGGGYLKQVDSVSWMASYTLYMMRMAVELAAHDPEGGYEQAAIAFLDQFVDISNLLADIASVWQDDPALRDTGFHYDVLVEPSGKARPVAMRSIIGLTPFFGHLVLEPYTLAHVPRFVAAVHAHRTAEVLAPHYPTITQSSDEQRWLFGLLPRLKLEQALPYLFDEAEMLAPGGIRSLSKCHGPHPARMEVAGETFEATYVPGEADSNMMGGNSNWRGPVWLPLNFVLLRSLYQLVHFYGDDAPRVEVPRGSGHWLSLQEAADHLAQRLQAPFLPDAQGRRPVHGHDQRYATDPNFRDLLLFYEYFDGDTSRGCGASHQTGWTALVALLDKLEG
ncbi:MAG TPA: glucosidase [Hymenobacter sp.]|uniref:glucosidase n=1 Tax=Hymenobacter sp. TaxID=1898978 RepID=UPI002D7F1522|nr:glucosidase [Hymenobacter sp.]HET9502987.1 glucosidase [Hymenobacter sp.]